MVAPALHIPRRFARYLVQCFAVDSRTLAVFRISLGLLILADLAVRSTTFNYFYTENGVFPQELARERGPDNAFSFYWMTQDTLITAILFVIPALIAVQLILGYRTTLATILSFLFVISLDNRNTPVMSHADLIFRLLFFWAIFIPLGERWSIDAIQRTREPRSRIVSLGTAAILLQMIYMYAANGYHKLGSDAWNSREATPLIFGLDDMTFFLAEPMRQFPTMLEFGGTMWYFMLLGSPFLLFLRDRPRMMFALMFVVAHFSFAITVRIGGFAPVGMAGAMLFLPARFWLDLQSILERLRFRELLLVRAGGAIERFGRGIAERLPQPGQGWAVPGIVRHGAYNVMLAAAIVAVHILPTLDLLAGEDYIDWERGSVAQEIHDRKRMFGVRQPPWNVFAPNPRSIDRYFVFPAHTTDGDLIDLYNDRPFSFDRPYHRLQKQYDNYRERFYMNEIRRAEDRRPTPAYLADYLCEKWRDERDITLTHINMYVVHERVTVDTIDDPEGRERWSDLIYTHGCFGNEAGVLNLPEDPP